MPLERLKRLRDVILGRRIARFAISSMVSATTSAIVFAALYVVGFSTTVCSITAFITVHQHTPNSSATCDTGRAFSPTWRHASIPARRVITACAST